MTGGGKTLFAVLRGSRWFGDLGAAAVVVIADYLLVFTDCAIAGRVLGEAALGALNLLMPVLSFVTFLLWLVVSGSYSVYAKALRKGGSARAAQIAGTGLAAAVATAVIVILGLAALEDPYVAFMGPGDAVTALSGAYWCWYPPTVLLAAVELMLFYLVYAAGGWMTCLAAYAVQTVVNLGASYGLCLKFGMGGLSAGSAVAYAAGLAVLLPRFCRRGNRIALSAPSDFPALFRSFRTSFADASVWLFHAVLFFAVVKYVLVAWDDESLAVLAVVFCIIRVTTFFGGTGLLLRTARTDAHFFRTASAFSFVLMSVLAAALLIAPEPLVGFFGIESDELVEGADFAARVTIVGLVLTTLLIFLPLLRRARRSSCPEAPLNYLQQYVLARTTESPDSQMFNLVKLFRLRQGVDLPRLANAIATAVRAHAALRTVLRRDVDGEVLQRQELSPDALDIPISPADEKALLANRNALVTRFDAFGGRLLNVRIFDCGGTAYVVSDFHHLVCDGYSFPLIIEDVRKVYDGGTLEGDAYYAVLAKRAEKANAPIAEATRTLLREVLCDPKLVTLPPCDLAGESGFGTCETPIALPDGFAEFLAARRVTRHHVFLAAAALALARMADAEGVLVDWVFHGRVSKDELRTVGAFMIDLPLRIENIGDLTPSDVLSRVKQATFSGIKSVNAFRAVEDVNPDGRDRLTFIYQDAWGELMTSGPVREDGPFGWLIDETIPLVPPAARPENPFNVEIMEHRESTRLFLEYDAGRYSRAAVNRYADLFRAALADIAGGV